MFILDPGSEFFPSKTQGQKDPGFGPAAKNLSILTQKIVSKLSKIWSGLFIPDPDPDPDFYPSRIPDPGVKKAPNPGSGSATLLANYSVPLATEKNMVAPANHEDSNRDDASNSKTWQSRYATKRRDASKKGTPEKAGAQEQQLQKERQQEQRQ